MKFKDLWMWTIYGFLQLWAITVCPMCGFLLKRTYFMKYMKLYEAQGIRNFGNTLAQGTILAIN